MNRQLLQSLGIGLAGLILILALPWLAPAKLQLAGPTTTPPATSMPGPTQTAGPMATPTGVATVAPTATVAPKATVETGATPKAGVSETPRPGETVTGAPQPTETTTPPALPVTGNHSTLEALTGFLPIVALLMLAIPALWGYRSRRK